MSIFDVDIHKKCFSNQFKKRQCVEKKDLVDNYCYFRRGYTHLMLKTIFHK